MTRIPRRTLICTMILASLAGCAGGDLSADPTLKGGDPSTLASNDPSMLTGSSPEGVTTKAVTDTAAASGTWRRIGGENETITVPANTTVRYGANGAYVQKVVSGTFQATNAFFGYDPIRGVAKSVEAFTPAASSTTWRRIGGENETITVPANSTVRYGANGAYVQKVVSGTFQATNAFFGRDPAYGVHKSVELLSDTAASGSNTAPAPTTPTTPTSTASASGRVLSVGPGKTYARIADAAAAAKDGDTVEISAGTYYGDVATWRQKNLTIRGVGGRPVLDANGMSAQGKGIFVISGTNVTIDNIEFANAKVKDLNGAGIRMEGGSLVVRNSVFRNNENSFITTADESATLEIYNSQFLNNGFWYTNGLAHGIYINRIGRLTIQGSYFTGTQAGHLVKSRAKESRILYNRITDEQGAASYQADFPDGGTVYLIGNIIEKNVNPQNPSVISYGMESRVWASNSIHVANNTIISRRSGGCRWIQAASWSTVQWTNNVQVGSNCDYTVPAGSQQVNNLLLADGDFANAAGYDFRLRVGSSAVGKKVDAGSANGMSLSPVREYQHTATSNALAKPATNPGAFQSTY